jgi:hypothetical protein
MRGLDPRIHQSSQSEFSKKMDGRDKPGHDGLYFAKHDSFLRYKPA